MTNSQGLITQDPSADQPWWSDWYSGMASFADDAWDTAAGVVTTVTDPDKNPLYQGVIHGVGVIYDDIREGVTVLGNDVIRGSESVGASALAGTESLLDAGLSRTLLIVGVLGVAIYFIAKTGAIKVTL